MTNTEFNDIVRRQAAHALAVLVKKGEEYGAEDRLYNFKAAAALQNIPVESALLGMLSKHLVSIARLCQEGGREKASYEVWDEKLGDAINYLLILSAVIREGDQNERV